MTVEELRKRLEEARWRNHGEWNYDQHECHSVAGDAIALAAELEAERDRGCCKTRKTPA